jgi:hypothetical protein
MAGTWMQQMPERFDPRKIISEFEKRALLFLHQ